MPLSIVRFLNIISASLLAGVSFGIWMGFNPENFSPGSYLEQQQNLIRSLNTLMTSLVIFATLIAIISAFLQRKDRLLFITLSTAAGFFIVCILISRFGNQPLQNKILNWSINTIPSDWKVTRDKWWAFHIMRTIAELSALVLIALGASRYRKGA